MVDHEDVTVNLDGIDPFCLRKDFKKLYSVRIIMVYLSPLIPSAGHMIDRSGILYS